VARRRLIVVLVALALLAGWVSWHMSADRLSTEEQRLVGTWRISDYRPDRPVVVFCVAANRRYEMWLDRYGERTDRRCGIWYMAGGELVIDLEMSPVRRALRPVGRFVRVRSAVVNRYNVHATPNRLVLTEVRRGTEFTANRDTR
jgi:hypothetical protein